MSGETATASQRGRKKAKGAAKKAQSLHPKYLEMVIAAIGELKERQGSSRQAILKYITGQYKVTKDTKAVNMHLKLALKRGIATGVLKHARGQGASGSFRLSASTSEKQVQKSKPSPVKKAAKKKEIKQVTPKKAAKKAKPKKKTSPPKKVPKPKSKTQKNAVKTPAKKAAAKKSPKKKSPKGKKAKTTKRGK